MAIDPEVAPGLEPAPQNKIEDLKRQTDGVIIILEENINSLIKREDSLERLEKFSKEMEEEAKRFRGTAQKVERSYCLKNVKLVVVIVVVVLVIILIIVLLATGVIPVGSPSTPLAIPTTPKP
ncbi:vesicle-associated membrane protein 8-like [Gadus macrocephalus]|uniref:vesicle-associated membrane protein 8-like n=1 Tax=Gadus macrocephalus TaxID=80720 RepID=UPI0028CB5213|nr:vesicle-associated membrane protein 8-like [Gadus macrocephalus]